MKAELFICVFLLAHQAETGIIFHGKAGINK